MSLLLAYISVLAALLSGIAAISARTSLRLPPWIGTIILAGKPVTFDSDGKLDSLSNKQVARRLRSLVFIFLGISGGSALLSGLTVCNRSDTLSFFPSPFKGEG